MRRVTTVGQARNPITGLSKFSGSSATSESDQAADHQDRQGRRVVYRERDGRNPILGEGDLGAEVKLFAQLEPRSGVKSATTYNPLNLAETTAAAVADFPEDLRPNGRPGKLRIEKANRDIIAGKGDFGIEWDPIYGYAGRPRQLPTMEERADDRLRSRSNPLTGDGVSSYEINQEMRKPQASRRVENDAASNPLTGENGSSYTISEKLNERRHNSGNRRFSGGNPLTGENCITSEPKLGSGAGRATSRLTGSSNPVTGANCDTYTYNCAEFRNRTSAAISPDLVRNPLTGENCPGFTVNAEEKHRQMNQQVARSNPVTGDGCSQFTLCPGEKRNPSLRSPSSPSPVTVGNPLTGENLSTFDVHVEQRGGRNRRC